MTPAITDAHAAGPPPAAHPARQLVPLAILLVALAAVLIAPIEAIKWYQTPFVGALFEPNHVVSLIDGNNWAAKDAGVDWPDRLIAVNSVALPAAADLAPLLNTAGPTVNLTFERRNSRATFVVQVPVQRVSFYDFTRLFLVPYIVGLIFLGLGIWVYAARQLLRAGRGYLFFCSALAVASTAFLDMNANHTLVRLWIAAVPITGVALAHLALVFPQDVNWVRRWPSLRYVIWLPCLGAIVLAEWQLYNPADPWAYIGTWLDNYLLVSLSLLLFLGLLAWRLWRSSSATVRQQCRVILFGGVLAFGPLFLLYLLPTVLGPEPARFVPLVYFPALVVFPLSVAYAIIRYRVPELDRFLNRQVAYGLMTIVAVVVYFALLAVLSGLGGQSIPANDPLLVSLALFAMVAMFNPLRRGAQTLIDRLFYRHRADYRRVLQTFSRDLTISIELGGVLQRLLGVLDETLSPERALIYLYDEAGAVYRPHDAGGLIVDAPPFGREGVVALRLREAGRPIYSGDPSVGQAADGEWELVARERLVALAPLRTESQLSGWLALGPKRSGEPYSSDELEYVAALAAQSALAVENARLFVNLRRNYLETVAMKNLLDDTFASIASGVIATDVNGCVTHFNRAAEQLLGLSASGVAGRPYQSVLPGRLDGLEQMVAQVRQEERSVTGHELVWEVPGRGQRVVMASVSPLRDARQVVNGLTIVFDDLTEQRRVEADRERIRQTFGRVVAPRVRDRLLSEPAPLNLAGTRQEITTLFADVRGFTSLSEMLPPEELFALLNDHLTLAAQAVLVQEGTIDKFLGDAIMALFNTPDPQPDHTLRAVRAALDMQARLAVHCDASGPDRPNRPDLHLGVAITVGEAVVGNVGTPELFNYTAIGDVVNLAKRLQERAAPGQILLSQVAYERVQAQVRCRALAPLQVKGRLAFEQVYEVLGLAETI
jgi:adenylate cyclase